MKNPNNPYPGTYKRPDGNTFWCCYSLRGKQYRQSTGETDQKKAYKFLQNKLKEVHADQIGARSFVSPKQEKITVGALLDALTADYKLRGKHTRHFDAHLKPVRAHFGEWRAVDVTAEAIDKFVSDLLEVKAVATVNRSTQILGQAFRLAVKRRTLTSAPYVRRLPESGNARQGFFSDQEFRAVVANLPEYLKDFARFGYLCGWRRGEIASLRWSDVEGDVIRLRGENAKNGEARCLVLDGELADVIERRKAARKVATASGVMLADLVFHHQGTAIVSCRKAWATACRLAGCTGKLFHDFRRTAVRNMVRAGVPERVAMSISGHKTRSIFDRYNIVSERDLRDAMQRTQTYLIAAAAEDEKRAPVEMQRRVM